MSSSATRRPRTTIEAFCCSNCQDEAGHWRVETFKLWDWVTMQPSMRGAHKVARRHMGERSHHWKGRIVELKQTTDGKKLAKVQHVYKATQLKLTNNDNKRYPANYIFPSNFVEWEPVEALTGTFQAYHVDLGYMIYSGWPVVADLLARNILFYGYTYMVPTRANASGRLVPILAPSLISSDWPIPDTTSVALASSRIESDVKNAMKCTYGSHRATITCFMPIHLFVHLFKASDAHRTPTMWIARGEGELCRFLSPTWDSKVVHHNGDTIKCGVIKDNILVRYHIAKQQLSIVFPYRRWKLTKGEWDALDSDATPQEQVELHVSMQDKEVQSIAVNGDWSLTNLREYLALRFVLKDDFCFVINGTLVRKRKERSLFCKGINFPHCIDVKNAESI